MPAMEPVLATLIDRAGAANPTVSASNAAAAAARSRSALADKAWYPDLTIGGGPLIQTNNRPVGFAATIGFNIPIPGDARPPDSTRPPPSSAPPSRRPKQRCSTSKAPWGRRSPSCMPPRTTDTLLRQEAMPQAHAMFETVLANYSQGKGDLAAAIAAEHQMHDVDLKLLQVQLDEQVELAAIERLIGGDL